MAGVNRTKSNVGEKTIFQNPSRFVQHANPQFRALWIRITARELESQSTANRGRLKLGNTAAVFRFLAPVEITETHNHSWEEYDSLQKRLSEKIKGLVKTAEDARAIKELGINALTEAARGGSLTSKKAYSVAARGSAGAGSANVKYTKVDAPLVYVTSERRELLLPLQLAKVSESDNLLELVQTIQKLSAPTASDQSIFFRPPHVFSLATEPPGLINYKYCALTSVQPIWREPFSNGEPRYCELSLTFRDISPLFSDTIEKGSVIEVGDSRGVTGTQTTQGV